MSTVLYIADISSKKAEPP